MGQAKQRGSFEQRQAEGIARREREEQARAERRRQYEASRTPAQRNKSRIVASLFATSLAFAGKP